MSMSLPRASVQVMIAPAHVLAVDVVRARPVIGPGKNRSPLAVAHDGRRRLVVSCETDRKAVRSAFHSPRGADMLRVNVDVASPGVRPGDDRSSFAVAYHRRIGLISRRDAERIVSQGIVRPLRLAEPA